MGSVVAALVHRYWRRLDRARVHALLVASATARIAAVFKAPAAGAIFARTPQRADQPGRSCRTCRARTRGLYAISRGLTGESLALTSGNAVIDRAIQPGHAIWLLVAVFAIRALGPTIAGGGVGGLCIPLMAAGAVLGRIFADAVDPPETTLYVTVGAACMLGGGYAAPHSRTAPRSEVSRAGSGP